MGYAGAIFGSELAERNGRIEEKAYQIRFENITYISDHFDRSTYEPDPDLKEVNLFDGTLLAYVDPRHFQINEHPQKGTVRGSVEEFDYVTEVFLGGDMFCVYFLILPRGYYPKQFMVPIEPHFAARIDERIRITWWFKDQTKIKLRVKRDYDRFSKFDYIDSPDFSEKHPKAIAAYREVQDLAARVIAETTSSQ